jgi:hypothetical protein
MPKNNIVVAQFSQLSDCEYELMVPGLSTEHSRLFLLNSEERANVVQQLAKPTTKPEPLVRMEMPLHTARLLKLLILLSKNAPKDLHELKAAMSAAGIHAFDAPYLPPVDGTLCFLDRR